MIRAQHLSKSFGDPPTHVLHDISFDIKDQAFVSISGRSGSGKTTLLYILSTLDNPSSGTVEIDGLNPSQLSVEDLHQFRNQNLGFIFQFHYLLPELTALENILMPARKTDQHHHKKSEAMELLRQFDLLNKSDRLPSQLSGGEQQRVAIARALIMNPRYIFADEPTGNLDTHNAELVIQLLKEVNQKLGTTVVLVTHEPDFAKMAATQIFLKDGHLTSSLEFHATKAP
jgi:putative ABC transport system ATP-binding protein/lipoprotein-releasing system ATP-binding protein